MPVVCRFSVTPVKGTALHHPSSLVLTRNGVRENRRFYLVDDRRRLLNGKQHGPLVQVSARYDDRRQHLSLRVPGREPVQGTPTPSGEAVVTDFYGRGVAGHLVDGPWSAALTEFVGEPVHLVAVDTPGDAVDVHPVTLVSSASIERLRRAAPDGARLDHRRFRMLVEVGGCEPHEEDGWVGRRLRLGGATVQVVGPVPRCVVTNENPDSGLVDVNTLKSIARYRGERAADLTTPVAHLPDNDKVVFGVYATVVEPGTVGLDDRVEPLHPVTTTPRTAGSVPARVTAASNSASMA